MRAGAICPHGHPIGYVRGWRARGGGMVVPLANAKASRRTATGSDTPGTVEAATIAECEPFADERPAMVANAIAMAKILDSPELIGLAVQISRQLTAVWPACRHSRERNRVDDNYVAAIQALFDWLASGLNSGSSATQLSSSRSGNGAKPGELTA